MWSPAPRLLLCPVHVPECLPASLQYVRASARDVGFFVRFIDEKQRRGGGIPLPLRDCVRYVGRLESLSVFGVARPEADP